MPEATLQSKSRLTFVIYKISAGGAQRVLTLLVNELFEKGWAVTLLTFDDGSEPAFFKLHSGVRHRPLSLMRDQGSWWKSAKVFFLRPWLLRKAIKWSRPNAVIAFIDLTNILTLVATTGLKFPVIISERGNPARHMMGKFWAIMRQWVYKRSACLVVQTSEARSFFSSSIQNHSRVISNPVLVPDDFDINFKIEAGAKILMAMGRLSDEKGFDLLIKAFAPLCAKFADWTMEIWGEGEERQGLENLRDELGLRERVLLPGLAKEHYKTMLRADIFVLSSRYEGFPNVLGEAMACGLPVVSFDCPSGPSEMINNGMNGILVPAENILGLSASLEKLMGSMELRKCLGAEARKISDRFCLNKIVHSWDELIAEVIEEGRI